MKKFTKYLRDVKNEMKQVTWPSKQETRKMSLMTLSTLVVAGGVIWAIDTGIVATVIQITHSV